MKSYDYKNYTYLRIPKEEFERLIKDYPFLKEYKIDYDDKQLSKRVAAKQVAKNKKITSVVKIYKVLKNYYFNSLFKGEKDITITDLSKIAGLSYMTTWRYWKELELDKWIERFKREGKDALFDFEIFLQSKYDLFL